MDGLLLAGHVFHVEISKGIKTDTLLLSPGACKAINKLYSIMFSICFLSVSFPQWVDREPGCSEDQCPRRHDHDDERHPLHCPKRHGGRHAEKGEN